MTANLRIGFIGIGNMGWPMAGHIVEAGYATVVYDADPPRKTRFVEERGGAAAPSLEALGRAADLVITMLPTGAVVRDVLLGEGGVASALAEGAVVVDMSSSEPVGTRELGRELGERGIVLIDAPVSGGVKGAEAGELTIMIGTDDEAAFDVAEPVLGQLGKRLFRIGSLGSGHAMKALNNYVGAATFTATAEALLVGKRFGLDPLVMSQVLDVSTGKSFHSGMSFPDHVIPRRFATGFGLGLLAKDVLIAQALSRAVDATTPMLDLTTGLWVEGRDEIGADADNSAVIKVWERRNGVVVES